MDKDVDGNSKVFTSVHFCFSFCYKNKNLFIKRKSKYYHNVFTKTNKEWPPQTCYQSWKFSPQKEERWKYLARRSDDARRIMLGAEIFTQDNQNFGQVKIGRMGHHFLLSFTCENISCAQQNSTQDNQNFGQVKISAPKITKILDKWKGITSMEVGHHLGLELNPTLHLSKISANQINEQLGPRGPKLSLGPLKMQV